MKKIKVFKKHKRNNRYFDMEARQYLTLAEVFEHMHFGSAPVLVINSVGQDITHATKTAAYIEIKSKQKAV